MIPAMMVKKDSVFYLAIFPLALKMTLIDALSELFTGQPLFMPFYAQVEFFPPSPKAGATGDPGYGSAKKAGQKAKVIFFISPGCRSCPDEAVKLEKEFRRLGVDYEIEGVFVGSPPQVGAYLAELRSYPFKFELAVDMDGSITRGYGVTTFPSAVIEMVGKRTIVTRSDELEGKLK